MNAHQCVENLIATDWYYRQRKPTRIIPHIAHNYFHVALLKINGGLTDRLAPKIQVIILTMNNEKSN